MGIHVLTILCDFFIRALLYVVRNVLLIILNRDKVFGRVMSVANGVAIATGFLMSPFTKLIQGSLNNNFVPFELTFLGIGVVMLIVPIHFVRRCFEYYRENIVGLKSDDIKGQDNKNLQLDEKDDDSL